MVTLLVFFIESGTKFEHAQLHTQYSLSLELADGIKRRIITDGVHKRTIFSLGIQMTSLFYFFKGAQVWDFDVLDFNDFFIMKSL